MGSGKISELRFMLYIHPELLHYQDLRSLKVETKDQFDER